MDYQKFVGSWILAESDNYDNYLLKTCCSPRYMLWAERMAAKKTKSVLTFEVANDGQHWKIESKDPFKINITEFFLRNEFYKEVSDGSLEDNILFGFDDGKLLQIQSPINYNGYGCAYIERSIESDGCKDVLVEMYECGDVTAVRKYERMNVKGKLNDRAFIEQIKGSAKTDDKNVRIADLINLLTD